MDQLTVSERFKIACKQYDELLESTGRQDSIEFQTSLQNLIKEFELILKIINQLSLFSDNEELKELSTNYIPYLNIWFYLSQLYSRSLIRNNNISIDNKPDYLNISKSYLIEFLTNLKNYQLLTKDQETKLKLIDEGEPFALSPQLKRQEKIENFKKEQQLKEKIEFLKEIDNDNDNESNSKIDEDTKRSIYINQLQFNLLKSFELIDLLNMEIQVLKNKPINKIEEINEEDSRSKPITNNDPAGFTTRVEKLPTQSKTNISNLISKQGRILQPFTITTKEKLKNRVFGTGQVLPSMTVEEYLDYELANGKLMKPEVRDPIKDDENYESDEDDDAQLEKRKWDDWKDENPKGAGNMGANIG
ncbi:TAP42 [Candida pseudojiufengensis]|uniref:TAP42 n=1 Tax=Candida pseudojiufengensis TaxID=497109 RepID=UPI0022247E14|nr:TAP42 [Candida pseudojiufengensis]KAI5959372.1 TAP42 [Candida pseudojiufengensis]